MAPKPQVNDGRIAHGNGTLELRLSGLARAQAHADILLLTHPAAFATGKGPENIRRIAAILKQDPSLLLEPIPKQYPLKRVSPQAWANADTVWKNHNTWFGNWLTRLVDPSLGADAVVAVALESGIHPDDATVWPESTLLLTEGWVTSPARLALALRYGARTDVQAGAEVGSSHCHEYMRRVITDLRLALPKEDGEDAARDALRCAHTLLDAGMRDIDSIPSPVDDAHEASRRAMLPSAMGMLAGNNANRGVGGLPDIRAMVFTFAERLHGAGASIDLRNGIALAPPVVQALRHENIDFACHLIRMGCKTADADIVRENGLGGPIRSLEVEAFAAGKETFATRILQAKMERQIALATGTPASSASSAASSAGTPPVAGVAPVSARRMRAV